MNNQVEFKHETVEFQYGKHTVKLETGKMARQASGAVLVSMGETVVLATVVVADDAKPGQGFFPLTVNYIEKFYSVGRIPGGYKKREGPPTQVETLTSRLIDRPIRPLFPKGFLNEVQIILTVMSCDPEITPDVPAMIGASAALALSGVPFDGPVGCARVGYINDEFVLNPSFLDVEESKLELVVAGTEDAVLMVESEAKELSEDTMLKAVMFGHEQQQVAIKAIHELVEKAGARDFKWEPEAEKTELKDAIVDFATQDITSAYQMTDKQDRYAKLKEIRKAITEKFVPENDEEGIAGDVDDLCHDLESHIVRERILSGQPRIDGRDLNTVRALAAETSILPRVHGSALFTRGETQALCSLTLGTEHDKKREDHFLKGDIKESFMLHYNFPPYSVGECGRMGGQSRREIGHGMLAHRALQAVLPKEEDFPYVLRLVSEILESNGSSSMATVCGCSLAMMNAGVPIKKHVAGIAMGLVKEGDRFAVLTDILGDEDHLGDMDFKVAGTDEGVTALQMDIKITGITLSIMESALEKALAARMHILKTMNSAVSGTQPVSKHAPQFVIFKIPSDKIGAVVGRGGSMIKNLTEETNTQINIADDGTLTVAGLTKEACESAKQLILQVIEEVEVGKVYQGKVTKIVDFGAFVEVLPGKEGLLHISNISEERIKDPKEVLSEGQSIKVRVTESQRGKFKLGMKDVLQEDPAATESTDAPEAAKTENTEEVDK